MDKKSVVLKTKEEATREEDLALKLRDRIASNALEMGRVLDLINTKKLHVALGFSDFEAWVKERLNISPRSAWYMIGWHKKQEVLDLSPNVLKGIATSKLKIVLSSKAQTRQDVESLADIARSSSLQDLRKKSDAPSLHKSVTVPKTKLSLWDKAIEAIRNDHEQDFLSESQAVLEIMAEYLRLRRRTPKAAAA